MGMNDKAVEQCLMELIPAYEKSKSIMDFYKKETDESGKKIKALMISEGLETFAVGNLKATVKISERTDFDEEALIAKLKELKVRGIIKKKEYVDMDALESAIYHEKVNAIELASCQIKKEVVTLRLSTSNK